MKNDMKDLIPRHKSDYDRVEKIIAAGYPKVEPIIPEILECIQDINWPIAQKLLPFINTIASDIVMHYKPILRTDDSPWKSWLLTEIIENLPSTKLAELKDEFQYCLTNLSEDDLEWEIDKTVKGLLERIT